MRLFQRRKPEPKQERESLALLDIAERMDRLERVVRDIRTDWEATYDKFHRLNMRLAKRQKSIEDQTEPEEKTLEDRAGDTNGDTPTANPLALALLQRGRLM